jgi:hypothetical protein
MTNAPYMRRNKKMEDLIGGYGLHYMSIWQAGPMNLGILGWRLSGL